MEMEYGPYIFAPRTNMGTIHLPVVMHEKARKAWSVVRKPELSLQGISRNIPPIPPILSVNINFKSSCRWNARRKE